MRSKFIDYDAELQVIQAKVEKLRRRNLICLGRLVVKTGVLKRLGVGELRACLIEMRAHELARRRCVSRPSKSKGLFKGKVNGTKDPLVKIGRLVLETGIHRLLEADQLRAVLIELRERQVADRVTPGPARPGSGVDQAATLDVAL